LLRACEMCNKYVGTVCFFSLQRVAYNHFLMMNFLLLVFYS